MPYVARDIEINGAGRFTFATGVDNVGQKVEKLFIPLLTQFIGQKTSVPLGNVVGTLRLFSFIKDIYVSTQEATLNREYYDEEDVVEDIDSIVVNQVSPNVVEFSFRVVMPDANLYIKGSVPISATSVGATVSPAATGFGAGEFGGGNFGG